MKSLFSVFLIVLVFSFLNRDVCAQGDGLPNRALEDDGPHSKMDPGYNDEWGRPPQPWFHESSKAKPEARTLNKGLLAPSLSDRTTFAGFLRMPNTGLVRLLPCELCDGQGHQSKNRERIRGGGAFYSFVNLTHDTGYASDIGLDQYGELLGGSSGDGYGILTNLGDVPLDHIAGNDPRAQFLSSYQPYASGRLARADSQRFRLRAGVTIDGLTYKWRMPAVENSTYLLRSISYGRSDVLIAFRVVRKDGNGSVIIAWKLLQHYPTPQLNQGK